RQLVEWLTEAGVTILVWHDFDRSGIGILHWLRTSGRRFKFKTEPNVIDLGLRMGDVLRLGLRGEGVTYKRTKKDPRDKLREYGTTEEECDYLVESQTGLKSWEGRRVELNELVGEMPRQFLEAKFAEHGVTKVVPDADTLAAAYQRAGRIAAVQKEVDD